MVAAAEARHLGDGSERAALERRAADLGLADRINFADTVPMLTEHRAVSI